MVSFILHIEDWLPEVDGMLRMHLIRKPPDRYLEFTLPGKVPVVIIPGIFTRWAFYKPLTDGISLKGFPVFTIPELENNDKDIPSSAKIVRDFIEEFNLANVVLVSHSKGGLIGKYLLHNFNEDKRVKELIAVAAPFSGSNLFKYMPFKKVRDFSPDSPLVKELKSYTDVDNQILSINPSFDVMIRHENGSHLDGARNIDVKAGGHNRAVNSKEVISIVINELENISKN